MQTNYLTRLFAAVLLMINALAACSNNVDIDQELVQGAQKGDMKRVEHALENGANVNARDLNHHSTALMWASHEGHLEIMRVLMQHGAKIDAKRDNGESALWFTAQQGRLQAMKLLVEKGADLTVVGRDGQSVYATAALHGHTEITDYLKSLGITE